LQRKLETEPIEKRPKVNDAFLKEVAEIITKKSESFLAGNGEVLAELVPRFIKRNTG